MRYRHIHDSSTEHAQDMQSTMLKDTDVVIQLLLKVP